MPDFLAVLADPSASYWLRDAIKSAMKRDPLDALRDAETLADVLRENLADIERRNLDQVANITR
jgi:hypothetical protein